MEMNQSVQDMRTIVEEKQKPRRKWHCGWMIILFFLVLTSAILRDYAEQLWMDNSEAAYAQELIREEKEELKALYQWNEADETERLRLMETVIGIESDWLQLEEAPGLMIEDLESSTDAPDRYGYYRWDGNEIHLNRYDLMNAPMTVVLETVLQESFCALQNELYRCHGDNGTKEIVHYLKHKVGACNSDFQLSGEEKTYEEYFPQESEVDARRYALLRMAIYMEVLHLE